MKIFTKDEWFTQRIEEMAWTPFDQESCDNLGLWLGIIQAVAFTGVKEVPNEDDCVALNETWALKQSTFEYAYRTIYIT